MAISDFCYIGREACGCVTGVVKDYADKDTASAVAGYIRGGRTIERVTMEQFKTMAFGCRCPKAQKKLPL